MYLHFAIYFHINKITGLQEKYDLHNEDSKILGDNQFIIIAILLYFSPKYDAIDNVYVFLICKLVKS